MAYSIKTTNRYEKNVQLCKRRGLPMEELKKAVLILEDTGTLPPEYRPHKLSGKYGGLWEAHIQSDWLLVWEKRESELILVLMHTGTHSDIF